MINLIAELLAAAENATPGRLYREEGTRLVWVVEPDYEGISNGKPVFKAESGNRSVDQENQSLWSALEEAQEYFRLILMQRENYAEEAAINTAKFATEQIEKIDAVLLGKGVEK